ncbi:MAG: mandelate racemase/muconate lactonizing enzyme family protein [Chloroflexi bacterium]|nr:mandelate racemase/muconate lactonizing enzyme family protein [Chloroflexota bacterium]
MRMKIAELETLHADAGGRAFDFLKITADTGLVGWSEYNEAFGGLGVTSVIEQLAPTLIGKDPRPTEAHVALMQALRRTSQGGVIQQAIGALENALLDLKARALDVPVYELFGGPVRRRQRVYWSHCGTYRVGPRAAVLGAPEVRTLDDIVRLGREVVEQGYSALKTNVLLLDDANPRGHTPGFARGDSFPELNPERYVLRAIREQLAAFQEGAGSDMDLLVDLNFNYKTEGYVKVARAMEPFDLFWVELDIRNPAALRYIRTQTTLPVATGECLFGRREYRPFFEHGSMDALIIDVPWNGLGESLKVAAMADTYEVNVAPHNFYGYLATMMSMNLCAIVPNIRIMETDNDFVPWIDELFTVKPVVKDGYLELPDGPGWGTAVNEAGVRAHPAKPPTPSPMPVGAR